MSAICFRECGVTLVYGFPLTLDLYKRLFQLTEQEAKAAFITDPQTLAPEAQAANEPIDQPKQADPTKPVESIEETKQKSINNRPSKRPFDSTSNGPTNSAKRQCLSASKQQAQAVNQQPFDQQDDDEPGVKRIIGTPYSVQFYQDGDKPDRYLYFLQIKTQILVDDYENPSVIKLEPGPTSSEVEKFIHWTDQIFNKDNNTPEQQKLEYGAYRVLEIA